MSLEESILSRVSTENVYRKNAFHILGLPTDATPKVVRRRKEDLDSAKEMGEQFWKQEFRHWLANTEVPSYQEVCDAFSLIEDPTSRLISEFFWVWSVDESDAAIKDFLAGNRNEALKKWSSQLQTYGRRRAVAQHNLAVVNHALAIEGEMLALDGEACATDKVATQELWGKCFAFWEDIVNDDDFWDLYEKRMREFDDPRLTDGFIRRIRHEFPIAFDDINARIAFLYARQDCEQDARRHVGYMKKTMSDIDDVARSIEKLFEPLENRVARIISDCRARVNTNAENGKQCVEELLSASCEILRAANYLLEPTNVRRQRILSGLFEACNSCLVAFGNKTKKWGVCLRLNKQLMPFACTQELKDRLSENQQIIQGNFDQQKEDETCAGCGNRDGQKRLIGGVVRVKNQHVKMYGNIRRNYDSFGGVTYSTLEVDVPCCDNCKKLKTEQLLASKPVARARKEGFSIGEKPPRSAMRKAWGLPASECALPKQGTGCLVPIVTIGFLVALAGCALAGCSVLR